MQESEKGKAAQTNRYFQKLLIAALPCALLALVGCGGEGGPSVALVPVKGTVTFDGKALIRGTVSFRPDKNAGNSTTLEPYGDIGPDGVYTMITNKKPGAPVGKYIVLVESVEPIDPNRKDTYTPKSLIPGSYAEPEKARLKLEVSADAAPGKFDLKLTK